MKFPPWWGSGYFLELHIRVFQSSLIIQPSVDDMGEGADDSLGVHDEGGE